MEPDPATESADFTLRLLGDVFHQVIHTLCGTVPPPLGDSPEDLERRDNSLIAQVACLLPANADEAGLAQQYVLAQAQAADCIGLARQYFRDPKLVLQFHAQSANMMRQARGARSLLMRVQAAREKREADGTALCKAEWLEHAAVGLMANALGRPPPAPLEPAPPEEPDEPVTPEAELAVEAEQYAFHYPARAELIRRHGHVPDNAGFGPPRDELARAIATGTTPLLMAIEAKLKATRASPA